MIAYGACAHLGGIPALANQFSREQILKFNYEECPALANEQKTRPQLHFEENGRHPASPRVPECGAHARPGGGCGLLHPGLSPDAQPHQGGL
jgi:hypothetical protein